MRQEIGNLQETNSRLKNKVQLLEGEGFLFKEKIDNLQSDNSFLKSRIEELANDVKSLSDSENAIRDRLIDLTAEIQSTVDPEMISRISKLDHLQSQSQKELKNLIDRLNALELVLKQSPPSGIFSYINNDEHQTKFIEKVEAAIKQEMTYSQIDVFLSKELPSDLVKIIKDHPSLTKNYIRNLRRD